MHFQWLFLKEVSLGESEMKGRLLDGGGKLALAGSNPMIKCVIGLRYYHVNKLSGSIPS
jgi:hypothetical protein